MRYLVISSMRDEGAFIVEWVAWQRMLGFTDILVVTNDCTDHSPELLDALAAAGWLTHLRHRIPEGGLPLRAKLRRAKRHPLVASADWILVCDVDEFLLVHAGDGGIAELLPAPAAEMGFIGMSVNWRVFGTSGRSHWAPGPVHRQFLRCAPSHHGVNRWFKGVFARPELFLRLGAHGPAGWQSDREPTLWGRGGLHWVDGTGRRLADWDPMGPYMRMTPQGQTSHALAQVNHYMIRSEESFGLKRGTLSAAAGKDRYTDEFFATYNRNDTEDRSALARAAAFDAVHAAAMALPGVARLHHLCCADYVARLCARAGTDPAGDPRHRAELAAAAAFA